MGKKRHKSNPLLDGCFLLTALDWEFYATLITSELKITESYIMLCSIFHLLLLYLKSINNGFK